MKTILVAVDLSAATVRVCAAAAALAKSMDGRLVIFHAILPLSVGLYGVDAFTSIQVVDYNRASRKAAAHKMQALQQWFRKRCPNTRMALHEGPAVDNILKAAARTRAEYIVLGSHGHGAVHDLLVGSTAHQVLRQSPCPVLLVPVANDTGKTRLKKIPRSFHGLPWSYD